jgi:hydroxymethylpyrimidine/phosphomethylpyrimidine kinase
LRSSLSVIERVRPANPAVLVIAGSDSSGGAGLIRDVRTLSELGAQVLCAVTAVTAQSDRRVRAVHHVPPGVIQAQIEAAFETRRPDAIKIGMLGTAATIQAVADALRVQAHSPQGRAAAQPWHATIPIVLDPVLAASSGGSLLDEVGREALKRTLLPAAAVMTPNALEAAALLGEEPVTEERALSAQSQRLLALGARAVLLKGGHAVGDEAVDWLALPGRSPERITSPRIPAMLRGSGCALASALAAHLAFGRSLPEACRGAKAYVVEQLQAAAERPSAD